MLSFHTITNTDSPKSVSDALRPYKIETTFVKSSKNEFDRHIHMFQYAKKQNMDYICITDDTIVNTEDCLPPRIRRNIEEFISNHPYWNIILLGGTYKLFNTIHPTSFPSVYNTTGNHGLSCYIIHKRLYLAVLAQYKANKSMPIDKYVMQMASSHAYIVYPLLFKINAQGLMNNDTFQYYAQFYAKYHKTILMILFLFFVLLSIMCIGKK
jgi:hypothetical protein